MSLQEVYKLPIFFILGRHRSGTTLLRTLLDAHPNINIPLETPFIFTLYPKYRKIKNWDNSHLQELIKDLSTYINFEYLQINKEKLFSEIMAGQGENSFQNFVKIIYSNYTSVYKKEGITLLGDKNPLYAIYPDKLFRIFPDAKYIFLTRDFRDHIISIKKIDFEAHSIPLLAYKWRLAAKKNLQLSKKYPKQFFHIRYEDLVKHPEIQMQKICDFLELPYSADVLNFYQKKDKMIELYTEEDLDKYHSSLYNPIKSDKTGIWEKQLTKNQIRIADTVTGKYAEIMGYQRRYRKTNILTWLLTLPFLTFGYFSYKASEIIYILPFPVKKHIIKLAPILPKLRKLFKW
jgi:hypothetical protein